MTIKLIFLGYLFVAAGMDIFLRKVKNHWILAGILVAVLGWRFDGNHGEMYSPAAAGVTLVFAYSLYRLNMMGAGDGKLFAVTAFILGPSDFLECLFWTFATALLFGFGKGIMDGSAVRRLVRLRNYLLTCFRQGSLSSYDAEKDKRMQLPLVMFVFIGVCIIWRRDIETLFCYL